MQNLKRQMINMLYWDGVVGHVWHKFLFLPKTYQYKSLSEYYYFHHFNECKVFFFGKRKGKRGKKNHRHRKRGLECECIIRKQVADKGPKSSLSPSQSKMDSIVIG